ncbi:MAG TPA: hypothetical protein VI413_14735 [Paludibacter sp.]
MKNSVKYSKILQIGLLLTFFLPFFPHGCEPKKAEEMSMSDSTQVIIDSASQERSKLILANKQSDSIKTTAIENVSDTKDQSPNIDSDKELTTKISQKSSILKLLLRPNDNYTGIASLIDFFSLVEFGYGLAIAFILWLISLITKLKDFNSIFLLINIIGLAFLSVSHSLNVFNDRRLWGFWVCLIWAVAMIIYDSIILFKRKKNN